MGSWGGRGECGREGAGVQLIHFEGRDLAFGSLRARPEAVVSCPGMLGRSRNSRSGSFTAFLSDPQCGAVLLRGQGWRKGVDLVQGPSVSGGPVCISRNIVSFLSGVGPETGLVLRAQPPRGTLLSLRTLPIFKWVDCLFIIELTF